MRVHGTLKKWNDEKGFGFVVLPQSHDEVFVHISAFPRDGVRPRVGETLSFEVRAGPDGRKRAEAVERPGSRKDSVHHRRAPRTHGRKRMGRVPVIAVVAIGFVGFNFFAKHRDLGRAPADSPAVETVEQSFTCDGRAHCSQMTSCAEARYFLRHCPGTKMDGDGDGQPCEDQWCR